MVLSPFCLDWFDMDLLQLFPDLLTDPLMHEADQIPVWTCGSGDATNPVLLAYPAIWHALDGLWQAVYWSQAPRLTRDLQGWVTLHGDRVTNAPLYQTTLLNAIRDQWLHTIDLVLDDQPWSLYPTADRAFDILLGHRRRLHLYDQQHIAAIEHAVRDWLRLALRIGRAIACHVYT